MQNIGTRLSRFLEMARLAIFISAVVVCPTKPISAAPAAAGETTAPLYLLTYGHGGMVLWGRDHFRDCLSDAIAWLDRFPSFQIGLDNEAHSYDYLAENDPGILEELRGYLKHYRGRFGIGTCTYGQPLSQFINEESNVRRIRDRAPD